LASITSAELLGSDIVNVLLHVFGSTNGMLRILPYCGKY